jgi:hypothetical protein
MRKVIMMRIEVSFRMVNHLYDLIFCVHYLCLIGRVYVFYVGHVDKSSLYETLFKCNILSKHHYHHHSFMFIYICILHIFIYTTYHMHTYKDLCNMYQHRHAYLYMYIFIYRWIWEWLFTSEFTARIECIWLWLYIKRFCHIMRVKWGSRAGSPKGRVLRRDGTTFYF